MLLGVCMRDHRREREQRQTETETERDGGRKTLILGQQGPWSCIHTPNSMPISTSTPLRGLCSKETLVKLLGLPPEVRSLSYTYVEGQILRRCSTVQEDDRDTRQLVRGWRKIEFSRGIWCIRIFGTTERCAVVGT